MLDPNLVLDFQQKFKQLQIHTGMGLTEENIQKVMEMLDNAHCILQEVCLKRWPVDIDEVPIKSK